MELKKFVTLNYDAAAQLLTGKLGDGPAFRIPAVSGGGRGSKKAGVADQQALQDVSGQAQRGVCPTLRHPAAGQVSVYLHQAPIPFRAGNCK